MAFRFYNPNPNERFVGDCSVRAITKLLDKPWDEVYVAICVKGYEYKDMPSANSVWGAYLKRKGYVKRHLPDLCPECYTVKEFCKDYPVGKYLLVLDRHVVTVVDGDYYDTWDSGNEIPDYYWVKGD